MALTLAVFAAVAVPAVLVFSQLIDHAVLRLGTLFAEKQILYDRSRGLEALMREAGLAQTLARSPAVMAWAKAETDVDVAARGLAELEHYRTAFRDRSYFFVVGESGNYYFNDAANDYDGNQLRYRLSATNPRDGWYYATIAKGAGCQLNVDNDDNLKVTKVWINCVVADNTGAVLGMVGTGIDLSTFIRDVVDTDQKGVESLFVDLTGAIQASRDENQIDFHSITKLAGDRSTVYSMLGDDSGRDRLRAMMSEVREGQATVASDFLSINGSRVLVGVGWLDQLGWYNVSLMDVDAVIDRRLFMPLLAVMGVVILAAAGLVTWLFKRSVLDRLVRMEEAVRFIERGDFNRVALSQRPDELGRLGGALASMSQAIDENRRNLEATVKERTRRLERMAFVDPLTEIANRRGFSELFAKAARRARRDGSRLGVLVLDLDRFKALNDEFGHAAGDEVVIETARRLERAIGDEGHCGRWGGDEFVVLVPDCTGVLLDSIAMRLLNAIRTMPFAHSQDRLTRLTTTVGAHLAESGEKLEMATTRADVALYAAKAAGRNRSMVFGPGMSASASRVA